MTLKAIAALGACAAALTVAPGGPGARAQEHRELGAHEHGVGHLDIGIDGSQIAMDLHVPGMDIVGFEHAPGTDAEREQLAAALATLDSPLTLFVLPEDAGCTVIEARAELETGAHHDHDDDAHDEGDAHDDEGGHTEFDVEYLLTCADIKAADRMEFAYFDAFPGAQALQIQLATNTGAMQAKVTRDRPSLPLGGRL
ncbi:MAG: hypothetical protein CML66_12330 [Rhodobacteraceae bacterium]|nr:hypothetical protein [Paracoccaceae bacterium]MAY47498.1 hypothetical protein [Paracoccaceae bacterium]